jgi:hypothetical protein
LCASIERLSRQWFAVLGTVLSLNLDFSAKQSPELVF